MTSDSEASTMMLFDLQHQIRDTLETRPGCASLLQGGDIHLGNHYIGKGRVKDHEGMRQPKKSSGSSESWNSRDYDRSLAVDATLYTSRGSRERLTDPRNHLGKVHQGPCLPDVIAQHATTAEPTLSEVIKFPRIGLGPAFNSPYMECEVRVRTNLRMNSSRWFPARNQLRQVGQVSIMTVSGA